MGKVLALAAGICHMIIKALAGTGKTTVLVQLVRIFWEQRLTVAALAFAKRDKLALERRTNGKAEVMTSNGAGHRMLMAYLKPMGIRLQLEKDLAWATLEKRWLDDGLIVKGGGEAGRNKWEESPHVFSCVLSLVEKARTCLCLKAKAEGFASKPTDGEWCELADRFNLEISSDDMPNTLFYAAWLFETMASLAFLKGTGKTDYAGQVFLPVYHGMTPATTYDVVLVDESQDQSFVNRSIAFAYLRPGTGRIIAVGDTNQAIYAWRGADHNAMAEMRAMMIEHAGTPEEYPLTLCRRCAKSIIAQAQTLVPEIQALPEAQEGEVATLENSVALFDALKEARKGLVLCRANAPLISMALRLIAHRVPAVLMRSNIVADLLRLIDQLAKYNDRMSVPDLMGRVEEWALDKRAKLAKRRNGAAQIQIVDDKVACLHALAEEESVKTSGDLKRKIDELFPYDETGTITDPAKRVVLSTVHGAKGGEADTVYLYSPDSLKVNIFDQVWSDAVDRDNTLYVAITRAERRLFYVGGTPTLSRFSAPGGMEEEAE